MTNMTLGHCLCGDFNTATTYEWLITNGIGGFACGTVGEVHTRRYHGLLIAALQPPVDRTLLVAKLDIGVRYLDHDVDLFSNEYADGTIAPRGFIYLQSFRLERGLPIWRYAVADALIEKRIVMQPGGNTTQINLEILRASADLQLTLTPLCTYRDYHHHSQGGWTPKVIVLPNGFEIEAFPGACRYRVVCEQAEFTPDPAWHRQFKHRLETARGLDDTEDLYRPGHFNLSLREKGLATVSVGTDLSFSQDFDTTLMLVHAELQDWSKHLPSVVPSWVRQLVLAAKQFVVERRQGRPQAGKTVIAGYPWFTDWGRDTMIALPGLTLALGHFDCAADILRTFATQISAGMVPNRFPDQDAVPEYNTVDATLWFIHAVDQYGRYSGDVSLARTLYPALVKIIERHEKGTRYGIAVDPGDGLLTAGEDGVQLTWMDAKVDDWVVTPRIGKCVEINALWYHALMIMVELAEQFDDAGQVDLYRSRALRVKHGFERFWNPQRQCLYDVIDAVEGELHADGNRYDDRLRPNQLFAVSLPHSPLSLDHGKAVVDLCTRELLTCYGLRSLAPSESGYAPYYRGDRRQRDGAYHQGTAWAWLIGPFVDAHYRVYRDADQVLSFLNPFALHLEETCLGQLGEIFDGNPPFSARGCFAQAWSVAEVLRVWLNICGSGKPPDNSAVKTKYSNQPHHLGDTSHE